MSSIDGRNPQFNPDRPIAINQPSHSVDPNAGTFGADAQRVLRKDVQHTLMTNPSSAVYLGLPAAKSPTVINYHNVMNKANINMIKKWGFFIPAFTRTLNTWARGFAEGISREKASRFHKEGYIAGADYHHGKSEVNAQNFCRGNMNVNLNEDGSRPEGEGELGKKVGFSFLKDFPGKTFGRKNPAAAGFNKHIDETFHAGDKKIRQNRKLIEQVHWFQRGLTAHAEQLGGCLHELRANTAAPQEAKNKLLSSMANLFGVDSKSREYKALAKKIEGFSASDVNRSSFGMFKSLCEVVDYDLEIAGQVYELAEYYGQCQKNWAADHNGILSQDKVEGEERYILFDHDAGFERKVSKDEKVAVEAKRDLNMKAQLMVLSEFENELKQAFKEAGGASAVRFGGNTYNCGLYGQNPHDKAREWTTLMELKWLVDGGSDYTPKHMYGPCGAMQLPAWLLGGVLSAVHHSSALTSLWCPHNGDFHGVDGLQLDPDTRSYGFVREGTELYKQFESKMPEKILKRDAYNLNPSSGNYEKGFVVPIDCVHSQNFLYIKGTETEMARNLRRLWSYKSNADVKVSSVATKRDGTDTEYLQMRGADKSKDSNLIVGKTKFSHSPGLYEINGSDQGQPALQEALVVEGMELYKKSWNSDSKDKSDTQAICVANFTQNHDDAFHEHDEFDKADQNGYDAAGQPNYVEDDPNTQAHHDHVHHGHAHHHEDHEGDSCGGCEGKDGLRKHLVGTVLDNYEHQAGLDKDSAKFKEALNNTTVKSYLVDSIEGNKARGREIIRHVNQVIGQQKSWNRGSAWEAKQGKAFEALVNTFNDINDMNVDQHSVGATLLENAEDLAQAVADLAKFEGSINAFPVEEIFYLMDQVHDLDIENMSTEESQAFMALMGINSDRDESSVLAGIFTDSSTNKGKTAALQTFLRNMYYSSTTSGRAKGAVNQLMTEGLSDAENVAKIKKKVNEACQKIKFFKNQKAVKQKLQALADTDRALLKKLNGFSSADGVGHRVLEALGNLRSDSPTLERDIKRELTKIAPYEAKAIPKVDDQGRPVLNDKGEQAVDVVREKVDLDAFSKVSLDVMSTVLAALEGVEERVSAHEEARNAIATIDPNSTRFKENPEVKVHASRGTANSRGSRGLVTPGLRGIVSNSTWLSGASGMISSIAAYTGVALSATAGAVMTGFTMPFSALLGYIGFETLRGSCQSGRRLNEINEITVARLDKVSEESNARVACYHEKADGLEARLSSLHEPIQQLMQTFNTLSQEKYSDSFGKGAQYLYEAKSKDLKASLRSLLKDGKLNPDLKLARYGAGNGTQCILPSDLKSRLNTINSQLKEMQAYVSSIGVDLDDQSISGVLQNLDESLNGSSNGGSSIMDDIDEVNTHFSASKTMLKQDRSLLSHAYMVQQEKKDNMNSKLTGIGYLATAGSLLAGSAAFITSVAVASVPVAIGAAVATIAAPIALGTLSITYGINALNKHREMGRLAQMKKQIEAVDLNQKESYSPKIVGYHQAMLMHIEERMEFLRTDRNRWARGSLYLGAMALGTTAAAIASGGAAAPITGIVSASLIIGLSGPLAFDTFHLFNRDSNWGGMYAGRSEDSQDMNDVKIDSPQDLKKFYWSKSKMLGLLGEKNAEMIEKIGHFQRTQMETTAQSGRGSGSGDQQELVGKAFNFRDGGVSKTNTNNFSDRLQNTRPGGMNTPKELKKGDKASLLGRVFQTRQQLMDISQHMRGMWNVVNERFFNPNYSQSTLSDSIAEYMDQTFDNREVKGVGEEREEFLIRGELAYGMKEFVLHKINYLNHFQQELETRVATLAKSDESAEVDQNTTKQLAAKELDRVSAQIQTLQSFIDRIEDFNTATNHGKYTAESYAKIKGDSTSTPSEAEIAAADWDDLSLQFMIATGAVNQLLQKQGLMPGKPLLKALQSNPQYADLRDFITPVTYQGRFGKHTGKVNLDTQGLLASPEAMGQLKQLLAKNDSSALKKNLADTMVYILPGLETNDVLTMFERFEIPNRMDLRNVQSGIVHTSSDAKVSNMRTYVQKEGNDYLFAGGRWSGVNDKVRDSNGETHYPRVANALMDRFDAPASAAA